MARVLAQPDPTPSALEAAVALWMPAYAPGAFTEALMELGATLCLHLARHAACSVHGASSAALVIWESRRPSLQRRPKGDPPL